MLLVMVGGVHINPEPSVLTVTGQAGRNLRNVQRVVVQGELRGITRSRVQYARGRETISTVTQRVVFSAQVAQVREL